MKKIVSLFLIAGLGLFLFTGCEKKMENIEGSLEDIMTKVYAGIPEEELPMMLSNTEVTEENEEGFLGTKDVEYEEALASESMTGSIAHSVVLVRLKEDATQEEIEKAKTAIKENVNPRKWICVGVEEDDVIVENKGNLIILIMTTEHKEDIQNNFQSLTNEK